MNEIVEETLIIGGTNGIVYVLIARTSGPRLVPWARATTLPKPKKKKN